MSFHKPRPIGFNDGTRLWDYELDDFQDQLVKAVDGYDGGNYTLGSPLTWTLSATKTINGTSDFVIEGSGELDVNRNAKLYSAEFDGQAIVNAGVNFEWTGTANLPKIGSREYSISQPLIAMPTGNLWLTAPPKWVYYETTGEWVCADADNVGGYPIAFPLTRLPNLAVLDKVAVLIDGAGSGGGSHGALPSNLPQVTLYQRTPGAGASTLGTTVIDAPGSVGNYDTEHCIGATYPASWTWTGLAETINSNTQYWIVVSGEWGANHADNALSVTHIECSFTCTQIAPG